MLPLVSRIQAPSGVWGGYLIVNCCCDDKMNKSNFVARVPLIKINISINISDAVVQCAEDHSFLFRIFVCLFNSDKCFCYNLEII